MKKSELTQLTQIIEHLVAREVRKQLPSIIAETFQNMMGKQMVTEQRSAPVAPDPELEQIREEVQHEETNLKASLREMFAGTTVMSSTPVPGPRIPRQFCKDPALNAILNETTPDLRQREGMVGMAAFQGGYSPAVAMAASAMGAGQMMTESEVPAFARNMPAMPGSSVPMGAVPMGRPPMLREGQESTHAPMAAIPEGISALDVARSVPLQAPVAHALTKNYSAMMKLIDKKKGKV